MTPLELQGIYDRLERGWEYYKLSLQRHPIRTSEANEFLDRLYNGLYTNLEFIQLRYERVPNIKYEYDLNLLKLELQSKTRELGAERLRIQQQIIAGIWSRYLHRGSTQRQNRTDFARALGIYMTSMTPSIPLAYIHEDEGRLQEGGNTLPQIPAPRFIPNSVAGPSVENLSNQSGRLEEYIFPIGFGTAFQNSSNLQPAFRLDLNLSQSGPFRDPLDQLKNRILNQDYGGHPLLLLLRSISLNISPTTVYETLRSQNTSGRDQKIRLWIRSIEQYLQSGKEEFERAIRSNQWQDLRPLTNAAKHALFEDVVVNQNTIEGNDAIMHEICDHIIEDMEPWSLSDRALAITTVLSILVALTGLGLPGSVVIRALGSFTVGIVTDISAMVVAGSIQNDRRLQIDRFKVINEALSLASPQENIQANVAWGLLYGLIPVATFVGVRQAFRRAARPVVERLGDTAVAARAANREIDEITRRIDDLGTPTGPMREQPARVDGTDAVGRQRTTPRRVGIDLEDAIRPREVPRLPGQTDKQYRMALGIATRRVANQADYRSAELLGIEYHQFRRYVQQMVGRALEGPRASRFTARLGRIWQSASNPLARLRLQFLERFIETVQKSGSLSNAISRLRTIVIHLKFHNLTGELLEPVSREIGTHNGRLFFTIDARFVRHRESIALIRDLERIIDEVDDLGLLYNELNNALARWARKTIFDGWRDRFWNAVRGTSLQTAFERRFGLHFRNGAPFWKNASGQIEPFTLEHLDELTNNPLRVVEPDNLAPEGFLGNSVVLEEVRRRQPGGVQTPLSDVWAAIERVHTDDSIINPPAARIEAPHPRIRVEDAPVRVRVEELSEANLRPTSDDRLVVVEDMLVNPSSLQREAEH